MLVIDGKEVFTTLEELVDPKHTALLLIDLENDFVMPGGCSDKMGLDRSTLCQIVPKVKRVLEAARASGVLVVHIQVTLYPNHLVESPADLRAILVRTGHKSGDSIDKMPAHTVKGSWGWQIIDELAPLPNESVVEKNRSNAFVGTNLDVILRSNGIKSVTIVGVLSHGCVMATANDATFFGYCPVLLKDCVAAHDPELHEAALIIMSRKMDVVSSKEVVQIWTRKHAITRCNNGGH